MKFKVCTRHPWARLSGIVAFAEFVLLVIDLLYCKWVVFQLAWYKIARVMPPIAL